MSETDEQQHGQADSYRDHAVRRGSLRRTGQPEIMGQSRASQEPHGEDPGVTVAFAAEKKLSARAPSGQGKGQPCHDHTGKIPEPLRMSHRLSGKPRMELAQQQIGGQGRAEKGQYAVKQVSLPEEDDVAQGAMRISSPGS